MRELKNSPVLCPRCGYNKGYEVKDEHYKEVWECSKCEARYVPSHVVEGYKRG